MKLKNWNGPEVGSCWKFDCRIGRGNSEVRPWATCAGLRYSYIGANNKSRQGEKERERGRERETGASGWQVVTELADWPPGGGRRGA